MKKKEFIELYMEKAGIDTKTEAKEKVELFIETLKEAMLKEDILIFRGLGTFHVMKTKTRRGRNPRTGEPLTVNSRKVIKFKVGRDLEDRINK